MKRKFLPVAVLLGGLAALLRFPQVAARGVTDGLRLCGGSLLPALFPFFVLTRFFSAVFVFAPGKAAEAVMRRFGVGGACLPALLLSFVGGYPVGAATVAELYANGRICKRDAERCLVFCNNSGPAFFAAVIGAGVFGSVRAGLALYGIHVAAALLCARLFAETGAPPLRVRRLPPEPPRPARAFTEAVNGAAAASLQITASVVTFSVITALLRLVPHAAAHGAWFGLLELSGGIAALTGDARGFVIAAFLTGWGGLCVHWQAMSFWGTLRPRGYLAEKLLHGALSALFAATLMRPTPALSAFACAAGLFCVIFPEFRKKRGSIPTRSAL